MFSSFWKCVVWTGWSCTHGSWWVSLSWTLSLLTSWQDVLSERGYTVSFDQKTEVTQNQLWDFRFSTHLIFLYQRVPQRVDPKTFEIISVETPKYVLQTKQNKTKQNKTKQNKTKQNKTKQNKTKQNKTKQNKTKQNSSSTTYSWPVDSTSISSSHKHKSDHRHELGMGW